MGKYESYDGVEEYEVPLQNYYSQAHSDPELKYLIDSYRWVK